MNSLLKVQNYITQEKIAMLVALAKNVPELLTVQWSKIDAGFTIPKVWNFFSQSLSKIERKKQNHILKILEDWLKNY